MRLVHVAALVVLLVLVAPAGAAARVGVTQHAINVTLLHEQTLARQSARAQADAQIVRERAKACLDEVRAVPESARKDLLDVYFNAVSGALWQTDRAGYEAWVARLAPAARVNSAWRVARAHLRTNVAAVDSVYRAGVEDPCTVVEAWKANGFDASAPPDEVRELRALLRSAERRIVSDVPVSLDRLLHAQGTRAARRALAAFARGADEPDAKVIRAGDPVFAALSR